MRRLLQNGLIILLTVLFTYLLLEIGYRVVTYQRLANAYEKNAFWWTDTAFYQFDETVGYRYSPDRTIRHTLTDFKDTGVVGHDVQTNNIGNISRYDDAAPDDNGVYRIALLGDSFTAGAFTGKVPGDVLEERLNELTELKTVMNISRFDVLNFGMEAIGLAQFVTVYEQRVREYQPDVLFVNFISDDLRRRFLWRGEASVSQNQRFYRLHLTCYSLPVTIENPDCRYSTPIFAQSQGLDSAYMTQLRVDLYDSDIARRPWLRIYPELLAWGIGHRVGIMPGIDNSHPALSHIQDDDTALENSRTALMTLQTTAPQVFLLHVPVHTDILESRIDPLAQQLITDNPDLDIRQMRFSLPPVDENTVRDWYNLPFDGHFNDRGSELFAEVML
ncbi:MAG: SGNH/GDSL hydrolase family protein, partial [Aggregatilineales bacterium]